jgi:glycerol-3-phosphate dehydrogenase (NAD(P)+)
MKKITVLGSGSWGTALAHALCKKGHEVLLWSRKEDTTRALEKAKENEKYLPGIRLDGIHFTSDITAVADADICVMAVPSSAIRETAMRIAPYIKCGGAVVCAAKGFDPESGKRLSEVIEECIPEASVSVLSGPSHAEEVALGLPTTNVIASKKNRGCTARAGDLYLTKLPYLRIGRRDRRGAWRCFKERDRALRRHQRRTRLR